LDKKINLSLRFFFRLLKTSNKNKRNKNKNFRQFYGFYFKLQQHYFFKINTPDICERKNKIGGAKIPEQVDN
jgi:hypothetical protein